ARYARADDFDAAIRNAVAQRAAHLLHGVLLRGIAARLFGDADQNFGRAAELLQLNLAETEFVEGRTHPRNINIAGLGLYLKQRAALEVDSEIQPVRKEQSARDDRQERRDRKADAAKAREVEMRVVRDDPQRWQPAETTDNSQDDDEG